MMKNLTQSYDACMLTSAYFHLIVEVFNSIIRTRSWYLILHGQKGQKFTDKIIAYHTLSEMSWTSSDIMYETPDVIYVRMIRKNVCNVLMHDTCATLTTVQQRLHYI